MTSTTPFLFKKRGREGGSPNKKKGGYYLRFVRDNSEGAMWDLVWDILGDVL